MIGKVLASLSAAGFDLDADELADTLWLAAQGIFPPRPSSTPAPAGAAVGVPPRRIPLSPTSLKSHARDEATTDEENGMASLHARTALSLTDAPPAKALPLRTPAAPGLPGALELSRALRPLRRRVPAKVATVLDEDETVRKIVEQDLWIPTMQPAPARWLELAVVVDTSASMLVWHATVRELRLLFERLGAFRDVRMWTIDTADRHRVSLLTRDSASPRDTKELRESRGRRAIVIVSDCIAPAWDGALPPILNDWARHQPIAILQLFPERLWRQTALVATHRVVLNAPAAGVPNSQLRATFPPGPPGWKKPAAAPIPVLTTEPAVLRAWAGMVARGGVSTVPAVVFDPEEEAAFENTIASAALTPARRIAAFQSNASAPAFKLACLLAAAPLQLPVMRLVQQALLPGSRQIHLAEVFVSGLLERVTPPGEIRDPDLIEFAFHRGVDDELLGANRAWEVIGVLEAVSHYINERFGSTIDFQSIINHPRLIGDLPVVSAARPFATVSAKVLARLGGRYAQAAKKLDRRIEKEKNRHKRPSPISSQASPFTGKWILWIDDNPGNNEDRRAQLEQEGTRFMLALTTEQAQAELIRRPFDAVISDLGRAEGPLAGFDLLDRVRELPEHPPVIIYSRKAKHYEREALARGARLATNSFREVRDTLAHFFQANVGSSTNPPEKIYLNKGQARRLRELFTELLVPAQLAEDLLRDPHTSSWMDFFLQTAGNRNELAHQVVDLLVKVFLIDSVQLWVVEESVCKLGFSLTRDKREPRGDAASAEVLRRAIEERNTSYNPDLQHSPQAARARDASRSVIAFPLGASKSEPPLVVLNLESDRPEAFRAAFQEWVEAIANSLARAWSILPSISAKGPRPMPKKFLVAFSFAGAQRNLLRSIAEAVEQLLGYGSVFLDEWFEHYLTGSNLDMLLQDIYGRRAELVVVSVPDDQGSKPWTRAEYQAIRALQLQLRASKDEKDALRLLPLRTGEGEVSGIFTTICPDIREKPVAQTAELIVNRLRLIVPAAKPTRETPRIVYLASCTPDMEDLRDRLKAFLAEIGWTVLPMRVYPEDRYRSALDEDLKESLAFIQLIGPYPWKRGGFDRIQNEAASALGIPKYRYRSPEIDLENVVDAEQREFLSAPEVIVASFNDFKQFVWKTLSLLPQPQLRSLIAVAIRSPNPEPLWEQIFEWIHEQGRIGYIRLRPGETFEGTHRAMPCQGFLVVCDAASLEEGEYSLRVREDLEQCRMIQLKEKDTNRRPAVGVVYWPPPAIQNWARLLRSTPLKLHRILGDAPSNLSDFFAELAQPAENPVAEAILLKSILTKHELGMLKGLKGPEFKIRFEPDLYNYLHRLDGLNFIQPNQGFGLYDIVKEHNKDLDQPNDHRPLLDLKRYVYITEEGKAYLDALSDVVER